MNSFSPPSSVEPLHFLLVEDDDADAAVAEHLLRAGGLDFVVRRVDSAGSLREALTAFPPHLVISDYSMPGFDGMHALRITQEIAPETPFIVLTGSQNEETAVACLRAGADDYILKDRPDRLASSVRSALEKRRALEESRRAARELELQAEYMRLALGAALMGIWTADLGSREVTIIYEGGPVTSLPPALAPANLDAFLGLIDPRDREAVLHRITRALESGGYSAEFRVQRADGERWVGARGKLVTNDSGTALSMIGVDIDITSRKVAETALRESEERFRALIENSSDGIGLLSRSGHFRYVSPSAHRLLGVRPEDFVGHLGIEFIHPDDVENVVRLFSEVARQSGAVRTAVVRYGHADGTTRWLETTWRNAIEEPAVRSIVMNARDVTEQIHGQRERERLVTAIEQAVESIMITDATGRIEYVNPAFETTTGYSRNEALGRTAGILRSGAQDAAFYASLWQTIMSGRTWKGHFKNRRKDGSLFDEEATISPIHDAQGKIVEFVAVKRDVTQEIALEAQLRQAQKMEAIGLLAGGVAHDFNNLLQAMLVQVTLCGRAGEPLKVKNAAAEVEKQIRHGSMLTRQLLLFARREMARTEALDLNEAIGEATTLLRRLLRENVAFSVELSRDSLPVTADRGQLEQVLVNLVMNAADAMKDGGRITLRSGREAATCWLSVDDTGCGIPESLRERIFEPFFTTKGREKGTGLGLAVVHGIVTRHGGTVTFRDLPGGGTSFRVQLPLSNEPAQHRPADPATTAAPDGDGERVLLVEDEESVRLGLAAVLEVLGYHVATAASAEEALRAEQDIPLELLITDMVLPGMTGSQLAASLLTRHPRVKVILMSGYTDDHSLSEDHRTGNVRFLQKPFDVATLARTIRAVLEE